jgi:hypothetical protein
MGLELALLASGGRDRVLRVAPRPLLRLQLRHLRGQRQRRHAAPPYDRRLQRLPGLGGRRHRLCAAHLLRGWGRHEIWRINPDGTGRRTVTGRLPARLLGQGITGLVPVAWSFDGRRLLAGLQSEFGAVPFAVEPRSGTVRLIGTFDYDASPEGISRDGRTVLVSYGGFASDDDTRLEIVPYSGGRGRVIARRAGEASWNG